MIEHHVTTLALSKRLKELGVPQNSYFYWINPFGDWEVSHPIVGDKFPKRYEDRTYSAYLSSELGELMKTLPWLLPEYRINSQSWDIELRHEEWVEGDTEANARASMLIYLLEHHIIDISQLQKEIV